MKRLTHIDLALAAVAIIAAFGAAQAAVRAETPGVTAVAAAATAEPSQRPSPPKPTAPVPTTGAEALRVPLSELRDALRSIKPLAGLALEFEPFSDADADAALRRGGHSRSYVQPFAVQTSTFVWQPEPGRALWVIAGRSGAHAVLAVLRPLGGGHFEHLASTVFEERETTIVLTYADAYPRQVTFSTCYGCPGEGGMLRLADDGRVEITYR